MLKLNESPSGSFADGANEYVPPAVTAVEGIPVMDGAAFDGPTTPLFKFVLVFDSTWSRQPLTETTISSAVSFCRCFVFINPVIQYV